jgi:uncharacterized SAM-binding protein YcdF (DUF218 family)
MTQQMRNRARSRGQRRRSKRSSRSGRGMLKRIAAGLAVLMAAAMLYVAVVCGMILHTSETARPVPSDCIIVLGAAVWNDRPSPALRERLDTAIQVYRDGLAKRIIVTGGVSSGQANELSEAAMSRQYLLEQGIPEGAILLEDQSTSTIENLVNSKRMMTEQGYGQAIIVTHGFHTYRAKLMADQVGIEASYAPVRKSVLNFVFYTLRECAGVTVFQLQRLWM